MLAYRIKLTADDNGTFLVTCPQLPIVATFGETEEEAKAHAVDAIETALASMIDDGEDIPRPDVERGIAVSLPLLTALKVNLYWALREVGITRAELARRLQWNRESVDRLFRLGHHSRLEQIEAALGALNRVAAVSVLPDNDSRSSEIEELLKRLESQLAQEPSHLGSQPGDHNEPKRRRA